MQSNGAPQAPIAVPSGMTSSKEATQTESPAFKTPTTTSRFRPGMEEMHPSKVHKSTTKPTGSVSRSTVKDVETGPTATPSGLMALAIAQNTPTKVPGAWPHMSSPRFDFTIGRDESVLSLEAQRIMDSVRGEAAKIKAQMQAERDKQDLNDKEANHSFSLTGRKIAQPKGKSGRFSDAHREEFKRMESIAGHASIWKNNIQPNAATLTGKSDPDLSADVVESQLPRSKSLRSLKASRFQDCDRLENLAPGKRAKKRHDDDTSSARPISRGEAAQDANIESTASKAPPQSRLPSAVTTPTKASLARTASVKHVKPSLIPSPSRSKLTQTTGSPAMVKSEGSKKYRLSLAKFNHMKSLSHRHQPVIANDPKKESAGPPLAIPEGKLNTDKALPGLPQPAQIQLSSPSIVQRSESTPVARSKLDHVPASPSPSKIPEARFLLKSDALVPDQVRYPSIANSPNITKRVKIPTASVPGEFTFRSDQTMLFNPAPRTPTIRQVRPSGISTPLAIFDPLPPIPHGLPNKKRRRAASDDEDIENTAPESMTRDDADEPRMKKLKSSPQKNTPITGSKIPQAHGGKEKSKGRGILSMSRLNMLARPKARR